MSTDPLASPLPLVIVGAGAAGSLLAIELGRQGLPVVLVDRPPRQPPLFRAEKLEQAQSLALQARGLLDLRRPTAPATGTILRFEAGQSRVVDAGAQYGIDYQATVMAWRAEALRHADWMEVGVRTLQPLAAPASGWQLTLDDGRSLHTRLLVLACGLQPGLLAQAGAVIRTHPRWRSLFLGFDLRLDDPQRLPQGGCNEHLEQGLGGIDYLTVFRIGERVRANLSLQMSPTDARVRALRHAPERVLADWFPHLREAIGPMHLASPVVQHQTLRHWTAPPRRGGLLLIGDAQQSAHPASGQGLSQILVETKVLSGLVPGWLRQPLVRFETLQAYYHHPDKRRQDALTLGLWHLFAQPAARRAWIRRWQALSQRLPAWPHWLRPST
ncbi:MAG: hypothetical protein RLY78_2720 [Pseudomonadota bacterium]|jgi:2-polyprenyl-6-methoxyphenol hydroxylase-like FAD-dependent oxidoreductase